MTAAARRAFVARLLASTAKLARHHGFAAALWRKMVIWFGLPAAIISGLSGAFAFTDQETRAGVLALVAALLVSLSTYFGAKEHGDQHLAAAKDYRALQWDIELLAAEDDPPADRIKALLARRKGARPGASADVHLGDRPIRAGRARRDRRRRPDLGGNAAP